jgi:hypothetical protein
MKVNRNKRKEEKQETDRVYFIAHGMSGWCGSVGYLFHLDFPFYC